jgi:hypothetical protein
METTGGDNQTITLSGPGIFYFVDLDAHWTKGYIQSRVWHQLTRHYQLQEHTTSILITLMQEKVPSDAIILAMRAGNIICEVPGSAPSQDHNFHPRSILEHLLREPLTCKQLKNMQDQIVRPDGVITLKLGFHWNC